MIVRGVRCLRVNAQARAGPGPCCQVTLRQAAMVELRIPDSFCNKSDYDAEICLIKLKLSSD